MQGKCTNISNLGINQGKIHLLCTYKQWQNSSQMVYQNSQDKKITSPITDWSCNLHSLYYLYWGQIKENKD